MRISANKLCILPLYLYLMMTMILIGKHKVAIPNKNLALFYMGAIGLLGFLSYYGTVYYLYKKNMSYKAFFFAIALYGVMYGIMSLTIVQLIFIVFRTKITGVKL